MKKILFALTAVLIAALIFGAFIITSSAATEEKYSFEYVSGGRTVKAPAGTTLEEVVGASDFGSTITFLDDYVLEGYGKTAVFSLDGRTLDLNKHSLTFIQDGDNKDSMQSHIAIGTNGATVQNGTIYAYALKQKSDTVSHPVFRMDVAAATLNLNNITSYTGGMIYSYAGSGIKVNVNGGEHHIIIGSETNAGGSFMETRANATLYAKDAIFYMRSSRYLFVSASYKENSSAVSSSYDFENCTIIAESNWRGSNIIYMNNKTTASFVGCNIVADLKPTKSSLDSTSSGYTDPLSGSIRLGEGTRIKGSYSSVVAVDSACTMVNESSSFSALVDVSSGTHYNKNFTVANDSICAYDFTNIVVKTADIGYAFEYHKNGKVIKAEAGTELSTVLSEADNDSTIKFLTSCSITTSGTYASINKNLTFDLNGKVLQIATGSNNALTISSGATVTVNDGRIVCMSSKSTNTNARSIFALSTSSTLNLNNIEAYAGCVAYTYSAQGCSINIKGGEYYSTSTSAEGINGLFETRSNMNFVAEGAYFCIPNSQRFLISVCSNKQNSDDKKASFIFKKCTLVHEEEGTFINYLNEFSKVELYDSKIVGNFEPTGVKEWDTDYGIGPAVNGCVVYGNNTYLYSLNAITDVVALSYGAEADTSKAETFSFSKRNPTGSLYAGNFSVGQLTSGRYTFAARIVVTERDTYEYQNESGLTVKATNKTDLQTVINQAKAGSEIKLLSSATVNTVAPISVNKNITVNLAGYSLAIYGNGGISVSSGAALTVKSGNIISADSTAMFIAESGAEIVFDGVMVNADILVSANNGSTVKILNSSVYSECAVISEGADVQIVGSDIISSNIALSSSENTVITVSDSWLCGALDLDKGIVKAAVGTYVNKKYNIDIIAQDKVMALGCAVSKKISVVAFTGEIERESYEVLVTEKEYTFNVKYDLAKSVGYYFVSWYDFDGNVIQSGYVTGGTTVTPPTAYIGIADGWTQEKITGWSRTIGGTLTDNFNVSDDTEFYAAVKEVVGRVDGAKFNLTLTGAIRMNFYIPTTYPAGVSEVKVYDENGIRLEGMVGFLGSQSYTMYNVGSVGGAEFTASKTVTVVFKYNGKEYSHTLSLSPYRYAVAVLADSENVDTGTNLYSETAHTLVADMARYSNNLYKIVYGSSSVVLDSILDEYGHLCSKLTNENEFSDVTNNANALSSYLQYITFEVSSYEPRYKFGFKSGTYVTDVQIKMNGWLTSSRSGEVNYSQITYGTSDLEMYSGNRYIKTAYSTNIPIYNIDSTVTIILTLDSGRTVSGTYSLSSYYMFVNATGELASSCREFIRSLSAYGKTVAQYRFPEGKVYGEAEVDFWSCKHEGTTPATNSARYCSHCQTYLVYYSDFGAVGNGIADDYKAIAKAHNYANSSPSTRKIVSGTGRFYMGSDYASYIGSTGVSQQGEILIKTDVDWSGAYFIFDDEDITVDDLLPDGTTLARSRPIFQLWETSINVSSYFGSGLRAGDTTVPYAPGKPMLLQLTDKSSYNWVRIGANASSGNVNIREMILIDAYGNVSSTTPIEWDYTPGSLNVLAYDASLAPITISGLDDDGNIACTIETLSNHGDQRAYLQYHRNITVRRSNVTIKGIDHYLTEIEEQQRQTYAGIINVLYAYNVTVSDCSFDRQISRYQTGTTTLLGSYEIGANSAVNISWIRCVEKGFFNPDGSVTFAGLMGTNYCRNMLFDECFVTSFDAHTAAYNITLRNSTFEHVNFIGGGEAVLENVTIYADAKQTAISLRPDYGSVWRGNFTIKNLDIRYSKASMSYMRIFESTYYNQIMGTYSNGSEFTTSMPVNVSIDGLTVTKYGYQVVNGVRSEWDIAVNTIPVYIYYGNVYNLSDTRGSLNYYMPTKSISVSNTTATIMFPTGEAFKDTEIYVDGVKQGK